MKKYHVKSGDGNGYYGVGYESYRQAESLLKISQEHDPQAYIVEEEYHFTNADRIRAMSDDELAIFVRAVVIAEGCPNGDVDCKECPAFAICNQSGLYGHETEWLKQPAEGD